MQEIYDIEYPQQVIINPSIEFRGFWIRLAAFAIDWLVVGIPFSVVILMLRFSGKFDEAKIDSFSNTVSSFIGVFWWIYFAAFHSSEWQATIGKRAAGLKVVDINGNRISFGRATGRYFLEYLSTLVLLIGFFMIGWTKYKQGLHDIIAKTYVVKA